MRLSQIHYNFGKQNVFKNLFKLSYSWKTFVDDINIRVLSRSSQIEIKLILEMRYDVVSITEPMWFGIWYLTFGYFQVCCPWIHHILEYGYDIRGERNRVLIHCKWFFSLSETPDNRIRQTVIRHLFGM